MPQVELALQEDNSQACSKDHLGSAHHLVDTCRYPQKADVHQHLQKGGRGGRVSARTIIPVIARLKAATRACARMMDCFELAFGSVP